MKAVKARLGAPVSLAFFTPFWSLLSFFALPFPLVLVSFVSFFSITFFFPRV